MTLALIGLAGLAVAALAIIGAARRARPAEKHASGSDAYPFGADASASDCSSADGGGCGGD